MNEPRATTNLRKMLAWLEEHPAAAERVSNLSWFPTLGAQISLLSHEDLLSMFAGSGLVAQYRVIGSRESVSVECDGIKIEAGRGLPEPTAQREVVL